MSTNSHPEYVRTGIKVYLEEVKEALLQYLKNIPTSTLESENEKISFRLFCPNCGNSFSHFQIITGKLTGGISGIAAGAYLGAQIGIAGGPFGAIAGTIPGGILGGFFGKNIGNNFDKPICPNCNTTFEMPKNIKPSSEIIVIDFEELVKCKAEYIISLSRSSAELREIIWRKILAEREMRVRNIMSKIIEERNKKK